MSAALCSSVYPTTVESYRDCWYAIAVRSRHEKIVAAQFDGMQLEAFLPLYAARRKWSDRWKTISLPLFPGYVFCKFDIARRGPVLAASGVVDVVRIGTEPAPIDESEITAIQAVVKSSLCAEPHSNLVKGQRVTVCGGPFNMISGTLIEERNSLRLVVSVELLNRSVSVEVDREWVVN